MGDWPALWPILQGTIAKGDTFAFAPDASEASILSAWIHLPAAVYVACDANARLLGSYYLKANQPGNGSHVCNAGYVVSEQARGQGVARLMCEHSQTTALSLGYLAMQFNFVVSSNHVAVHLWQALGFTIRGTLPGAFRHPQLGFGDAYVMYKWLGD